MNRNDIGRIIYHHKKISNANRNFILNGSSGNDDISAFLDFSQNPSAINPKWNYVYSANNQPDTIAGILYPGYYVPEDRAKRITQLLEPKNDWDKESISKMQTDITNPVIPDIIKEIISTIDYAKLSANEKHAIDILRSWNGAANLKDIAPTVFYKFIYQFLKNTYEDEMGEKDFERLLNTHLIKSAVALQLKKTINLFGGMM